MKHRATAKFWKLYDALSPDIKSIAEKNFELLKANPKHPSLHFKNIKSELWSARIGMNHRALALESTSGFDWIWIGRHEEYDRLIK